ncbi:MAG: hypothetical protein ACOH10_07975 [Rhodoglobus sp.]
MAADLIVTTSDLTLYQSGDPQSLIDQATADVRGYCHWHVTPSRTETVTLDGSGSSIQILPSLHVTAVTSVTYDGVVLSAADYSWSEVGVIEYSPSGPYFAGACRWLTGLGKVVVVMTHGHAQALDLARIILAMADRSQNVPDRITQTVMGPRSESYSSAGQGFSTDEIAVLDRYRLPGRP